MPDVDMEQTMRSLGVQRYDAAVTSAKEKGALSTVPHAQRLLSHATTKVEEGVKDWLALAKSRPGANHIAVKFLRQVKPGQAALIVCRSVIDKAIMKAQSETSFARNVGLMVEHEAHLTVFKREAAAFWKDLVRDQRRASVGHKRKVFLAAARRTDTTFEAWSPRDRLIVGLVLVDIFIRTTGILTRDLVTRKKGRRIVTETLLWATPETLEWMEAAHEMMAARLPVMLPTLDPPMDWTNNTDGGYTGLALTDGGLMKAKGGMRHVTAHLNSVECPIVLDGVNTLQTTGWRVNPLVSPLAKELWESGAQRAGLPAQENKPLPPKPEDIDTNPEALKKWKRAAAEVHRGNAERVGHRMLVSKTLGVADMLGDKTFYYPQKLCFRGRAYPMPNFLEPQGADLAKGLLQFERSKRVTRGSPAAKWLSLHAANLYGDDKLPLTERWTWAERRAPEIIAAARDPHVHVWWADGDKPWQLLAVLQELATMFLQGFVDSRTPVALDGSNNGLQILSLMLRDPVGGFATNCIPGDPSGTPQDIYRLVADGVTERLGDIAEPWAVDWRVFLGSDGLPRTATKRPVMTLPYGVKRTTFRDYIRDWYRTVKEAAPGADDPLAKTVFKLADLVWSVTRSTVPLAVAAMDWMQVVARVAAKANLPLVWRTPVVNLMVGQSYKVTEYLRIETKLNGSTRREVRMAQDGARMSLRKMQDAVSPNVVHSLDASAMYLTIHKAKEAGVRDFSMVHDSFACHAADTDIMYRAVREAYAEIFSGNFLADWREQILSAMPEGTELPEAPAQGDMNPAVILDSPYYFL